MKSTSARPSAVGQARERPSRRPRLPSRLQGYEITPLRRRRETALLAHPLASPQFDEDALPAHSREDYLQGDARSVSNIASMEGQERASIRASINNAWIKLNEYYILLGRSPLFAASVVLNPDLGLRWLETNWTSRSSYNGFGMQRMASKATLSVGTQTTMMPLRRVFSPRPR